MGHLSFLSKQEGPLVLDASGVINLGASLAGAAVLSALGRAVFVVAEAAEEVTIDRRSGRNDGELLAALVNEGLITIAQLDTDAAPRFAALTIGSAADTLDDGEAATIAYAAAKGAIAIVDERKAIDLCQRQNMPVLLGSTVDIFAEPRVEAALGTDALRNAVFNALSRARMRVLPQYVDWVVNLIGVDRARKCPSLPQAPFITTTR